jgi:hypothetical protein
MTTSHDSGEAGAVIGVLVLTATILLLACALVYINVNRPYRPPNPYLTCDVPDPRSSNPDFKITLQPGESDGVFTCPTPNPAAVQAAYGAKK